MKLILPLRAFITLFFILIFGSEISSADESNSAKKIQLPIADILTGDETDESEEIKRLEGLTFQQLENNRATRKLLIDYLLEEGKVRENPKGTLDFLDHLNDIGREAIKAENRTRTQMFTIISKNEKRSIASVGREFHKSLQEDSEQEPESEEPLEIFTSLLINTPLSLDQDFVFQMVNGYLHSLGYGDVKLKPDGDRYTILGKRDFGSGAISVAIEKRYPNSKESIKDGTILFDVGGSNGSIPPNTIALEGISIVVNPANPVDELTVSQVADIFAGKVSSWSKYENGTEEEISVLVPTARPGLVDQFRETVMNPEKESLQTTAASQPGSDLFELLASQPSAITICRPGEVTDNMKTVRIKDSSDSIGLAPNAIRLKSLDYPLLRLVSVRAEGKSNSYIDDFITFCQSTAGQAAVSKAGYIGNGPITDEKVAQAYRQRLIDDPQIPADYKMLVRKANRLHSPANFRFVPGTTTFELTDYSEANLRQLITYLRAHQSQNPKVILVGFADSQGDYDANKIYSKKRADSIADKLKEEGITNLVTEGFGEEIPVADNSKETGRNANRRVEVWIE
ncbi:MAG: phosphate ABC transporter substrate-binding/OmpA family protein [Verrucomicrobiales bacterium]|nr:phosphate ABC transporter substrate-binding/OmpA family protein [Verrucomicrobiales bacterium]